jgi:hypothetical protein
MMNIGIIGSDYSINRHLISLKKSGILISLVCISQGNSKRTALIFINPILRATGQVDR